MASRPTRYSPLRITPANCDGVEIQASDATQLGKSLLILKDKNGAPIVYVGIAGGLVAAGDLISTTSNIFGPYAVTLHNDSRRGVLFGYNPSGGGSVGGITSGSGVPTTFFAGQAKQAGEYYFRTDTPSTANQRIYVCTAGGTPGTWSGIV